LWTIFSAEQIPHNWIPSVERRQFAKAAVRGFLAGFPMTDFRATLYDGKYHDVDSSDISVQNRRLSPPSKKP